MGSKAEYDPIIKAADTRSAYNVDGSGMTVAVIDTGVDYRNPALGGSFGRNAKVIAGYDFAADDSDPIATSSQHGTAVAGLIGSTDPDHPGVAPGVDIVALRVIGDDNSGDFTMLANALQWVIDNHETYNISVVNLSLSDGGNYAQNWFANSGGITQKVTGLIGQLKALNIPVVAATGNSFNGNQGQGFSSIVSDTISVTATDLSDQILPDAQRLGTSIGGVFATDLAAPGAGLTAPSGDKGSSSVDGTSFAAPLVSGATILLQEIYKERFGTLPTVDQIDEWLTAGAQPVTDAATGITVGRLDVLKSAALVPQADPGDGSDGGASPSDPDTGSAQVQLFVDGKEVSGDTVSSSSSIKPDNYASMLHAMDSWADAGVDPSDPGTPDRNIRIRVWGNAPRQDGSLVTGANVPAGSLALIRSAARASRLRWRG
jgi:type VI secretion system secreted protein VgrG